MAERNVFGSSISNINGSGETKATVVPRNWITGTGGSGGREASAMSRQQQRRRSKLLFAVRTGRRQGDSELAVTVTGVKQICI